MLGTHYSLLSDILLEEAQGALKQQSDEKAGKRLIQFENYPL